MNTKHFKDKDNKTFGLDTRSENWEDFVLKDWIEITIEEARLIANPQLSQHELDAQKESKNISFISSEINRVETKLTQLYRLRDRNKASESHLSQIEELEDYSTDLMLVEDQKGFPLKVKFPLCPDFFKEVNNG